MTNIMTYIKILDNFCSLLSSNDLIGTSNCCCFFLPLNYLIGCCNYCLLLPPNDLTGRSNCLNLSVNSPEDIYSRGLPFNLTIYTASSSLDDERSLKLIYYYTYKYQYYSTVPFISDNIMTDRNMNILVILLQLVVFHFTNPMISCLPHKKSTFYHLSQLI